MSERIKKIDVAEDGIISSIGEEAKRALVELKKFDAEISSIAKSIKGELNSAMGEQIQDIQKINELTKKAAKVVDAKKKSQKDLTIVEQEQLKIQKAVKKAQAQKILADSKENKELQKLRAEKNKINKATRDEIKQAERNKNAYTKLSDASRRYKNESKTLGAELLALEQAGKKNTKVWNDTQKRYTQVTAKAKTTDAQLKKLDATVGDNQRSVGNYAKATRGLSRALGTLGIAVGVGEIFRKVGGIVGDFDQAVTDLGAISGKTAEELAPLNKQARELGATTQFSATEVTKLQIELAKLGFTTQEIMDSTGGIANFAAATGVEIPRAAALAGSALRAFGLDATEIDRVVSTLGVATTKTALDFSKLENGLSTVAPVAKAFGFSIEDTTALLGQLANSGFDASSAATATRNILLNLADANGDLAKQLGRPIKSADDLAAGLAELQSKGVDLGEALELTDKRSVAAFQTFLDGSDSLVDLRDSITDVNDELTDMSEKRLQSVSGAMKLLSSAFEEQVLGFNEATGASDAFQASIKFVADNLGAIFSIMGKLVALMLVNIARQKILNSGILDYGRNLVKAVTGQKNLNNSMKASSGNASKFGKSMKNIGWTVLIGLALDLGKAFYNIASGASRATYEAEQLEKAQQRIGGANLERINAVNKALEEQLKNIQQQLDLEEISAEKAEKLRQDAIDGANKQLEEEKSINKERVKELQDQVAIYERATEVLNTQQTGIPLSNRALSDLMNEYGLDVGGDPFDELSKLKAELQSYEATVKALTTEQSKLNTKSADSAHSFEVLSKSVDNSTESNNNNADSIDEQTESLDDYSSRVDEIIAKEKERQRILEIDTDAIEEDMLGERPDLPVTEDDVEDTEDNIDELYKVVQNGLRTITEVYEENVDRRIAAKQREIDAYKSFEEQQQALAAEGNINAQNSIKESIQARRKEEAEIRRMEQRKQQVLLISQGLESYLNLLEGGESPTSALAQTTLASTALIGFLSGLQGFWTGTDDAPEGFAMTQEKGRELIFGKDGNLKSTGSDSGSQVTYLEKGDIVKNASDSANMLRDFENLKNLQRFHNSDKAGNTYDLLQLASKLDEVKNAIKSQPQSITDWENITRGLGAVKTTTRKGGDTFTSKHYVRK